MNNVRSVALAVAAVALAVLVFSTTFILRQAETALVLQFGAIERVENDPGLKFKLPWQSVVTFDRRVGMLLPPPQQVLFADQTRLDVDAYAVYRIINPEMFFQSVNNENVLRVRLAAIVNSSMRRVLGGLKLASILTGERESAMAEIRREVFESATRFGVEVTDVRLRRADFPDTTSAAIYNRMRSERDRDAKQFRGEGQRQAQIIRAEAERDRTVTIANARRDADIIKGLGDASALRVYAASFGQDPGFFEFFRSLQAYREAFGQGGGTPFVMSPDADFLRFLKGPSGLKNRHGAPTAP